MIEKRIYDRTKIKALKIMIMVSIFVVLSSSVSGSFMEKNNLPIENYAINARYSILNNTIRINSDADFNAANGVISGNGSISNPYVIANWEIDAKGDGAAIYIGNTTKYFIIENCYIYNASIISKPYYPGCGIMLYNVTHGIIRNNTVLLNKANGFYFYYSYNIETYNNTISNNGGIGIRVYYSQNITISSNNISNNGGNGIRLDGSSLISISNNHIIYNGYTYNVNGIYLNSSSNNTIQLNTIQNNSQDGIYLYYSNYNTIYKNFIANNTYYGIYLYCSNYNTIYKNFIANNTYHGIYVISSKNGIIRNNTVLLNKANGFYFYYSYNIETYNNTISNNGGIGIRVYYSQNITISSNNISNNGGNGIRLDGSSLISISNNHIIYNGYTYNVNGIYLNSSSNNTIQLNTIQNNSQDGIYLYYSNYNTIYKNFIANNTYYGIYVISSKNNIIYNNTLYFNNGSNGTYNTSCIQAYDDSANNQWYIAGTGNYWYDWANNNDTNDQNGDGIVDWPYKIAGPGNATDLFPLKNPSVTPIVPQFPGIQQTILIFMIVFITFILKIQKTKMRQQ